VPAAARGRQEQRLNVIGVVDLLAGRAVHARRGNRARYRPIRAAAGIPLESGDPASLARVYVEHFGLSELYVADLDAILGGATQGPVVAQLASLAPVWLDAGVSSSIGARRAFALGVRRVIVGLETLASFHALDRLSAAAGAGRIAFSLDLRDGEPIGATGVVGGRSIEDLVDAGLEAGIGAVIVIDLSRIGASLGPDFEMVGRVRAHCQNVPVIAGGGIRDGTDLIRLADAGCDGVLVATALVEGRLTTDDLRRARELQPRFHGPATG
jgi:phosphoribosylformimino-5-aminoimidazole carboxamide ribotide isomerase